MQSHHWHEWEGDEELGQQLCSSGSASTSLEDNLGELAKTYISASNALQKSQFCWV